MELLTNLAIVQIPHNDAPPYLTEIGLIDVGAEGVDKENNNEFEKKLGRIPNVQSHETQIPSAGPTAPSSASF